MRQSLLNLVISDDDDDDDSKKISDVDVGNVIPIVVTSRNDNDHG